MITPFVRLQVVCVCGTMCERCVLLVRQLHHYTSWVDTRSVLERGLHSEDYFLTNWIQDGIRIHPVCDVQQLTDLRHDSLIKLAL